MFVKMTKYKTFFINYLQKYFFINELIQTNVQVIVLSLKSPLKATVQ